MNLKTINILFGTVLIGTALTLTGCGGGGGGSASLSYTGLDTPAAITADNVQNIGASTSNAASVIVSTDNASNNNPFGVSISTEPGLDKKVSGIISSLMTAMQSSDLPVAFTLTSDQLNADTTYSSYYTFCGGSISGPDKGQGTFTMNNLCVSDYTLGNIILNGSFKYTSSTSGSGTSATTTFTTTYSNFSISVGGQVYVVNTTLTCTSTSTSYTCYNLYKGTDGKTYTYGSVSVYDNGDGTYSVTAALYLPDYGSVDISAPNISFNCPNDMPDTGTVTINGASGTTATITFSGDCSAYTYTYDLGGGNTGSGTGTR